MLDHFKLWEFLKIDLDKISHKLINCYDREHDNEIKLNGIYYELIAAIIHVQIEKRTTVQKLCLFYRLIKYKIIFFQISVLLVRRYQNVKPIR
jgi:hypothetical protein